MIQDILPKVLHNEFAKKSIARDSVIFSFEDDRVLCDMNSEPRFPLYGNVESAGCEFIYLFDIDGTDYFLAGPGALLVTGNFAPENVSVFRSMQPCYLAFAGITAHHLYIWYRDNRFCGRCGSPMARDAKERMLTCGCGNRVYPKISPVVIVGVSSGDKLLLTKYAGREYTRYALIAGFIEIGESAEEAVRREVMEEVGIRVKNIRYYKSQPWGFSESLLFGYFAELDGDPDILLDRNELSEAVWLERDEILVEPDNISLTNEMICAFETSTPSFS